MHATAVVAALAMATLFVSGTWSAPVDRSQQHQNPILRKCMKSALLNNNLKTLAFISFDGSPDLLLPVPGVSPKWNATLEASPCPVLVAFETIVFQNPKTKDTSTYFHRRRVCAETNSVMHDSDYTCEDRPDTAQFLQPVGRNGDYSLWVASSTCVALKKGSTRESDTEITPPGEC